MPSIMQDKYILGQSQSGTVSSIGEEIRLDLKLTPNTNSLTGGNVSGTVKDSSGQPIQNALIKIMDSNYAPLMHTITDAMGNYTFTNIPSNETYNIFAIASGMTLNQGNQFTVSDYQNLTINFTLTADPAMSLGVIAGDLIDQSNNQPINGAVVSLYLLNPDNTKTLEAVTYTNQYGQYTFREVPQGTYVIEITSLGYNTTTANVTISQTGQLVPMTVSMVQNPSTSRGTVSGIITDNNNQPIDRADVILYQVNSDGSLTPLAFTKTTTSGIYLFANVGTGTYKVKANESEVITVNI